MDLSQYVRNCGRAARTASRIVAQASTRQKNEALLAMAQAIAAGQNQILEQNRLDVAAGTQQGLADALLDRLELTPDRVASMVLSLQQVASLPDPVGEISDMNRRPSGIEVGRMRVPLGVIGIIYESRPNVTADAGGLCLKSGNAAILRGGSEAIRSNLAIAGYLQEGLQAAGLPVSAIQVFDNTDRSVVGELLGMSEFVDVIVPRGGRGLIERVSRESTIPVIKHLDGNCHVYVDSAADIDQAVAIAFNAKCRRYGVCGAMETLLLAESVAEKVLQRLVPKYRVEGVEIRGCEHTRQLVPDANAATEEDWGTEFLAPVLAVRVVANLDQAIEHIERYGSGHTDAIVTQDLETSRRFLREVDSSSVMVNASTQFADGFEYGLGAEIGISTDKLHVRGPVGLEGLTTRKFIVLGAGSVRS
ncbi:MAG TPA: glutamate-5-semialdehyde dehydrogenase [Gammaproteobacteria bacterium]|nr:glutamate-5-semialdehyde dehydrogenase [Gammaproteobacteria bacterium]RTZ64827.1 MAG: glutamate-5-semialdehyde dehydrogenase [Gammaproteobacteria bacterium]HAD37081.1 glutamate-5-semialdehyde dehydrogenase [Gammaproteobacteria bacterium]HBK76496.1 glutamate-5-semialdehyde dehydrogenase [Gammaproteobacteria bacterium]HHZ71846.1 glutamate-5-semialdehyde dehydrogenase [Gammaproteobacteria bacterium]